MRRARSCGRSEPAAAQIDCSYVLPLRLSDRVAAAGIAAELAGYLEQVATWCAEVIVVDGSAQQIFELIAQVLPASVRHIPPDPRHAGLFGKVTGVLTGLDLAAHEAILIADDDVRYEREGIARVVAMLREYDLVRPQNYFDPHPWHALWDTARTLLNRATGADFPGTLGVRSSTLRAAGGYDADVLFENLELIRTIEGHGGTTVAPLDLYVRRLPPSTAHFLSQRTRQAYDDLALPLRMGVWLAILPTLLLCVVRRRPEPAAALALSAVGLAEFGRRRAGGTSVFPSAGSLLAPAWLLERGACAWLALLQRSRYGGVRYGDSTIRVAAHSRRDLRRERVAAGRHPPSCGAGPKKPATGEPGRVGDPGFEPGTSSLSEKRSNRLS